MDMQSAIRAASEGRNLNGDEMTAVMRTIMTGEATPAQIGGFLVGLRMKGETVEEIAAAAGVMRELATHVEVSADHLVDTCGTGGDGASTFNISTTSAFVVAGAGGHVAKHGNRSVSSQSGSADILEAAGVNLNLTPDQVAVCINEARVGFMFAPAHHSAMKHAIGPRKEMAVRTIFNVLGPLTNPASAPNQVIGVFSADLVTPVADVLGKLGSRHVMVAHAEDGLDEISIASPTKVAELKEGVVTEHTLEPEQFGLNRSSLSDITVSSVDASLAMLGSVLANEASAARDIVALNAGAAIYVCGLRATLKDGVQAAHETLASGAAREQLDKLVAVSNRFAS